MLKRIFLKVEDNKAEKTGFSSKMFILGFVVGLLIMLPMIVALWWVFKNVYFN